MKNSFDDLCNILAQSGIPDPRTNREFRLFLLENLEALENEQFKNASAPDKYTQEAIEHNAKILKNNWGDKTTRNQAANFLLEAWMALGQPEADSFIPNFSKLTHEPTQNDPKT